MSGDVDSRYFNPDDYQAEARLKGKNVGFDYPSEPIGDGNPYHRCIYCKRSAPEINGEIKNHHLDCEWRMKMENPKISHREYTDAVQHYFTKYVAKHPHIRLGQFLCNLFLITDSIVFYQEDQEKVMELFTERHIETQSLGRALRPKKDDPTEIEVMESLKQKMTSGNSIECSGCRITREEYEVIMKALKGEK